MLHRLLCHDKQQEWQLEALRIGASRTCQLTDASSSLAGFCLAWSLFAGPEVNCACSSHHARSIFSAWSLQAVVAEQLGSERLASVQFQAGKLSYGRALVARRYAHRHQRPLAVP